MRAYGDDGSAAHEAASAAQCLPKVEQPVRDGSTVSVSGEVSGACADVTSKLILKIATTGRPDIVKGYVTRIGSGSLSTSGACPSGTHGFYGELVVVGGQKVQSAKVDFKCP